MIRQNLMMFVNKIPENLQNVSFIEHIIWCICPFILFWSTPFKKDKAWSDPWKCVTVTADYCNAALNFLHSQSKYVRSDVNNKRDEFPSLRLRSRLSRASVADGNVWPKNRPVTSPVAATEIRSPPSPLPPPTCLEHAITAVQNWNPPPSKWTGKFNNFL